MYKWGYVVRNVADAADPPRAARYQVQVWTPEELRAFFGSTKEDRHGALWFVYAATGMRRGEALGLRWEDVDLKRNELHVRRSLVTVGHTVVETEPKTASGFRTIGIDTATVAQLKQHRAAQHQDRLLAGPAWTDSDAVFSDELGQTLHPNNVGAAFRSAVRKTSLPRIRLHDLRHGWATMALMQGVPAKVASQRLGHSSVAFTLDTYSHVLPEMQIDAAERVAELFHQPSEDVGS